MMTSRRRQQRVGTARKDRARRVPAAVAVDRLEPPRWLGETARRYWGELVALLKRRGVLDAQYSHLLALLADQLALREEARKAVDRDGGVVLHTKTGAVRAHPALRLIDSSTKLALQIASKFGLTPADLARLDVAQPSDEYSDLLG